MLSEIVDVHHQSGLPRRYHLGYAVLVLIVAVILVEKLLEEPHPLVEDLVNVHLTALSDLFYLLYFLNILIFFTF